MLNKKLNKSGFTIVELLVVIVVIGILAAITIVSYSGISKKAIVASLQSDLDNNSRQLKLYYVEYGYYPNTLDGNKCPNDPTADTRYCLKASGDTALTYSGGGQAFTLTATKNGISYEISENAAPYNVTKSPVTAIAPITGTLQVSQTLTAGAVTPAEATVSYQWQSAATSGGTYTNINGATNSTYIVSPSFMNKYLRVVATATGQYSGQVNTETASAIASDSNWVTVGSQTWAKANSNVGTMIAATANQTNNSILEKYCVDGNCVAYGGLYQWNEAMQYVNTEGAQGICPAGSHIPSDNDWKILEMQLGMTQVEADKPDAWRGTNQGTQLKTGSSGLTLQLSGNRYTDGTLHNGSQFGYYWSSTESSANAFLRVIYSVNATVMRPAYDKAYGESIRCLAN